MLSLATASMTDAETDIFCRMHFGIIWLNGTSSTAKSDSPDRL
jgi:hypothetical protein